MENEKKGHLKKDKVEYVLLYHFLMLNIILIFCLLGRKNLFGRMC